MGYFSNGTEGLIYEEQWCSRCIHRNGPNGDSGCDIMLIHLLRNYEECNNPDSILHMLIPRTEEGNGKCRMFWPEHGESR